MIRALGAALLAALVVAGCGSTSGDGGPDAVQEKSKSKAIPAPEHVIATLGDSIVAGSPRWDPDAAVRDRLSDVTRTSQWQYWVDDLPPRTELRNCGVWGERTDEIADRFAECTEGADGVIIQGGINDIVQGRPVPDAARDLACMAERARAAGLDVAIADVLPWNNGYPDAAPKIKRLNGLIAATAKRGGVPLLPFFATLDDPENRDRMPEDLTDDGNHPTPEGYRMLGERAWRAPLKPTAAFTSGC